MLEPDPWLGGVLGRGTFRLTFPAGDANASPSLLPPPSREAVFIYAKVDVDAHDRIRYLESLGFGLIDTNITFSKPADPSAAASGVPGIRLAAPADEAAVVALAQVSFRNSRFHKDAGIPAGAADRLKGEWVRNYFLGARGDAMVVAEDGRGLCGFLLLLKSKEALTIDLVAVDERRRGGGLAAAMTRFAEARFPGPSVLRVGTQIANGPSIRSYQKMGFLLAHSQYIFHYHGPIPDGPGSQAA